ncbi:small ribosomal subunit Rsm22 family protein [Halorussus halobius]|uniref:small ribosomal subunit Rsm22 family protein n=1 Tax=Halorussus halobius TaxID=1710537 RepID=UPI0010931253|nr:class I SAM-dependent methyltransferase [Halorussus halobius]
MNAERREQVRSNARYLRNVRPLDPDEIAEYVEGQPHPAVVRQVLREEAASLDLVERDDGTFVPVDDDPVSPAFAGVEAFPDEYARALEDLLVERVGPDWHAGESGDGLRATIRTLKDDYFRNEPVEYDDLAALGYAIYHLPDNYAVAQYVLHELAEPGLVGRRLRILDVGAGVGGPALGVHDYLPADALVEYEAVEPSAAADVFEALVAETGRNFHPELHRTTAEAFAPGAPDDGEATGASGSERTYDLILFANVLNELDDPESVVSRYLDFLADDGTLVAIEPADRETAIGLRAVERAVADEAGAATVFAPTLRLWPGERPTDRGWSFDVKPDLAVPSFQRKLDEGASESDDGVGRSDATPATGEFVNVDVQFAYSLLRTDGRRKLDFRADPDRSAKMAEMDRHVTHRIDLVAVKLSHSLADDDPATERDPNPVFKVSDGSESTDHFAVLTDETSLNADLRTADYGDLLSVERALVLWNDDEAAYNLVVDEETVVDRIPA